MLQCASIANIETLASLLMDYLINLHERVPKEYTVCKARAGSQQYECEVERINY